MKDFAVIRIRIISIGIILFAFILIAKLYVVQVVDSQVYRDKADRQYVRPNQSLFDRGSIFFETKDKDKISAATLESGFTLAADPKQITDDEAVYEKINALYPLDKEDFLAKVGKKNDPYEELAKRVPSDVGLRINELEIPGIRIYKERWRFYPGGKLASQVLGFLSYKGDDLKAQYGLERSYDSVLTRDGNNLFANFFVELFSNINKTVLKKEDLEGDIVTTIDPVVQGTLEKILGEIESKYSSKLTGGIIMNPKNGEIYAMASSPTFDPNDFQSAKSVSVYANPNVEDRYEMGSIIKPLTMAAGIDAGVVTPDTKYDDKGFLTLDKKTFYNYDHKGRGVTNMQEVLNQSLNTGVAFVVSKLGRDTFRDYMYNFGFGEKTGIDVPNEASSSVSNLQVNRDLEYAQASFGQGIALTPIQTVRALAALGNGGILVTPHVVKRIEYRIGVSRTITYPEGRRVLKPETSVTISKMLTTVVDKALLNGEVKMDRYSMAAKTGTAQMAGVGGYDPNRFLHSFFGYLPATDPKFIIFLFTVEPQGVEYASHTLTVPFSDIAKFLINYYQVPPDR